MIPLPPQKEEKKLITFEENNEIFKATLSTYNAWTEMKKDSKKVGIDLILVSAFRSIKRQEELIDDKRKKGIPEKEIYKVLAPAGHSEHHTGCALDLHTPNSAILEEDFEKTVAFEWLNKNAGLYGFELSYPRDNPYGVVYEPWHWCFRDKSNLVVKN